MMMEKLVEWLAVETEVLGENLPQCLFVHHKTPSSCPGANPGRRGGKPETNRLSYGTASDIINSAFCEIITIKLYHEQNLFLTKKIFQQSIYRSIILS
jgi:hypothetical protein